VRAATIPAVLLSLVAAFCLTAALGACRRQPEERAPALDLAPPLAAPPQRIVPATAAAAELVADLVDPARVAALPEQVDSFATRDFSTGALGARPRFPRYLAEPVLSARPDLVITHSWQSQDTTALLRAQGVPVLVLRSGTDYAEVRATLLELGRVLGAEARATALVDGLDRRVARLREHAAARPRRRALV
jgi:iron complex transport system substrate-binding protein